MLIVINKLLFVLLETHSSFRFQCRLLSMTTFFEIAVYILVWAKQKNSQCLFDFRILKLLLLSFFLRCKSLVSCAISIRAEPIYSTVSRVLLSFSVICLCCDNCAGVAIESGKVRVIFTNQQELQKSEKFQSLVKSC